MAAVRRISILFCFFIAFGNLLLADNLDSLRKLLPTQRVNDRLNTLRLVAMEFQEVSEFDSAIFYTDLGLKLALKTKNEEQLSKLYNTSGVNYWNKGEYTMALSELKKGLALAKKRKDLELLSSIYNNLGLVYWEKADYPNALKHLTWSLDMDIKLKDKDGMSSSILNIGLVYDDIKDYEKALKYYKQSLKLSEELKDEKTMAICYTNMGGVYNNLGNHEEAMKCYVKSVKLSTKVNDLRTLALANNNIAVMMFDQKKYDEGIGFYLHALHLYEQTGDISGVVLVTNNLGDIYGVTGDYLKSLTYYEKARAIADSTDMLDHLISSYYGMANSYSRLKKYDLAYTYLNMHKQLQDSFLQLKNTEEFNKMRTEYEVKQKEMELNAQRAKEKEVERAEKRQQYFILGGVGLFLLLTIIFSFFLYKRIRISQRQNKIIQQQKHLVEEKQQEILDSINYAQRIQQALLPHEQDLARLFKYSFVLFKPKDIVSGDFYWITEKGGYIFYATADCTGHGVPGGFMSMLGTSFLNEIINEKNILDPGEVLNQLREKVIAALRQKGSVGENKDGMDIALCRINKQKLELVYAAANNAVYVYHHGVIKEYKADKMPIGHYTNMKPFESKTIALHSGDVIYTFTDGFADQFGGPKGKKFKYGQLTEKLQKYTAITTTAKGLDSVKSALLSDFLTWKGDVDQTDDVCVIGVAI